MAEFMTEKEVAELLRIEPDTLKHWRFQKKRTGLLQAWWCSALSAERAERLYKLFTY